MRVRKAIFPAAGLGTRFLPATKAQPKEMLPLVDKPVIQYVVEEAVAAGLEDIIIVTGRGKNAIEDHFDRSLELEAFLETRGKTDLLAEVRQVSDLVSVAYIRQKEPLGLGHAILVARNLVGDEPFAVLLGDDVIDSPVPCIKQMLEVFDHYGGSVVAVEEVPGEEIGRYGVVDCTPVAERVFRVRDLVEKPPPHEAPSSLAIVGRYVLTPTIFQALERTGPDHCGDIQLTNGLRQLLSEEPVFAYAFTGRRYDAGSKLGFLQAVVELALKRPDIGKDFHDYLQRLQLETGGPLMGTDQGRG
ncbi:MAG: UTP--glucose-1-phosphate uridylyltransferase GalU [Candidatus Methylomirabilales bacterium]